MPKGTVRLNGGVNSQYWSHFTVPLTQPSPSSLGQNSRCLNLFSSVGMQNKNKDCYFLCMYIVLSFRFSVCLISQDALWNLSSCLSRKSGKFNRLNVTNLCMCQNITHTVIFPTKPGIFKVVTIQNKKNLLKCNFAHLIDPFLTKCSMLKVWWEIWSLARIPMSVIVIVIRKLYYWHPQ